MHPALTPGRHSITVDGIVQRYHVHGAGPVCVVHPGGPGLSWEHLRLPGLERSNTIVYVEPIGTGESGRLPGTDLYTLARYATHLRAIVEAVGGPAAALLGHAHGGSVVQQYITTNPDSVRALVLACSTPVGNDELIRETADNLSRFAEQHARHNEATDIAAAYLDALTATDDHTLTHAVRRLFPAYFRDYWDAAAHAGFFKLRSEITAWAEPSNRRGIARTDFRGLHPPSRPCVQDLRLHLGGQNGCTGQHAGLEWGIGWLRQPITTRRGGALFVEDEAESFEPPDGSRADKHSPVAGLDQGDCGDSVEMPGVNLSARSRPFG
jgi:proline iminopeptidase